MAGGRAVPIEYDLPQSEVRKRCFHNLFTTSLCDSYSALLVHCTTVLGSGSTCMHAQRHSEMWATQDEQDALHVVYAHLRG